MTLYYVTLLYSTLIYVCRNKLTNYTKFISNNSTAVHILGHGENSTIFLVNFKIRRKRITKKQRKVKMHKNIKIGKNFIILKSALSYHALHA